jgi:hypothetical protein
MKSMLGMFSRTESRNSADGVRRGPTRERRPFARQRHENELSQDIASKKADFAVLGNRDSQFVLVKQKPIDFFRSGRSGCGDIFQ